MYQSPYRYPRKKTTPVGAKILAALIAIAVLVGGIWYLSSLGSKIEEKQTQTNTDTISIQADWYVGKDVALAGTLSGSTEPLAYSHTLITTGGETIRLNSSTIDLNNYNGFVYIKGTVSKFNGENATVNVKAIGNTEGDLQSTSFSPSSGTKFFPAIALKINTSANNDITYTAKDNTITFSNSSLSGTVEVVGFKCEAGYTEKDCTTIAKQYTDSPFVNKAGMSISKDPNGSGWFAQNSAGVGYKINASSDALLYKISGVLIPINETYIKTLLPTISKLCTPGTTITNPTITKESLDSWIVKTSSCTARVSINEINGEKVTILSKEEATTVQTGTAATTITPTTSGTTNNTSTAPKLTASGYDFTSTRGNYTIHFPSAAISYNGTNVSENLGVKGLSCYVNIGVKSYADRDNDAVGPAVEIYECTSKLSSSSISVPGTTMQTSADGTKLFFIKTLNSNRNNFAQGISIK